MRKRISTDQHITSEIIYRAAMYLRLSRDDMDIGDIKSAKGGCDIDGNVKSESNSISNQRNLIRTFLQEHDDIELYDSYVDDRDIIGLNQKTF